MTEVSRAFPRLSFVIGDGERSCFIHKGKCQVWRLPRKRVEALTANIPEEGDLIDLALVEADWAMMDEVVDHWNAKTQKTLAIIAHVLHAKSKARRKRVETTAAKRSKK